MKQIYTLLRNIGVPANLLGYEYLATAVSIVLDYPYALSHMTTYLYPAIATAHGTTPSRVERNIRRAIEHACVHTDPDILIKYFGNVYSTRITKLTNSQCIARLVEHIKIGG